MGRALTRNCYFLDSVMKEGKRERLRRKSTEIQQLIKNNLVIHFRNKPDRTNRYERDTGHSIFMHLI